MQTLGWYWQRLGSMSAGEIAWRVATSARDRVDRFRIAAGRVTPPPMPALCAREPDASPSRPLLFATQVPLAAWRDAEPGTLASQWKERLCRRADAVLRHEFSFFNLRDRHVGSRVDWHRDHEHDVPAPRGLSMSIDYRDYSVTGDAKNVWEPNRHQHLVLLGRAYRATGDARYAVELADQLDAWLEENPFGYGMNWRSPLELAIRLINWAWGLELIRESGIVEGDRRARVVGAAWLHAWDIQRKYSRGSSANNHRIGEAAGVFVAACRWPEMPGASEWRARSRAILVEESLAQTYADGGNREQAIGYHAFVAQFLLVAGLAARACGEDFPSAYWARLEKMIEFLGALLEGGEHPPMFGDADDGYVLDLGGAPTDMRWLVDAGAVLFNRPDLKLTGRTPDEALFWLLGTDGLAAFDALPSPPRALSSKGFPESGYYLLQAGTAPNGISVLFDCGELGFGSIAAHGHADALSVMVRAFGHDILVDPGTYDYFTYPAWRRYFRGTSAHNTLVVDGLDQSTILGPFLWGQRAASRCIEWKPTGEGGTVTGEHDGYERLTDPVRHRRTLSLQGAAGVLSITDTVEAHQAHEVAFYFHLGEQCEVVALDGPRVELNVSGHRVRLEIDERLQVALLRGTEEPGPGWVSRGYHRKTASAALRASGLQHGSATYTARLEFSPSGKGW